MFGRSRSEPFLLEPELGSDRVHNVAAARKKAEQESLLLANRIRLLRAEDAKTRKKIADTEKKTRDIIETKVRNEERRLARDALEAEKEAAEAEFRAQQLLERAEQQKKIDEKQRRILDQNKISGEELRRQRGENRRAVEAEREAVAAEVYARAEYVRQSAQTAGLRRARSEGARQEAAKDLLRERLTREEAERNAKLADIESMEKEEAELMMKLQRSQERHRQAFVQLEDAVRQSGQALASSGLTPTSSSFSSSISGHSRARRTGDSAGPAALCESRSSSSLATTSARPPRPRQALPSAASSAASRYTAAKPATGSAYTGAGDSVDRLLQSHSASATQSNCSTAESRACSGYSTPSSKQIRYTTADGLQLDIPVEEELDLAALLNG
mmetsp:Transcript_52240/g.144643  ORF Transcript_52240/g.144643 Transcript_52240/m.144643 type:complete len:387 (-) Transcript_52240:85-1245(-)